MLLLQSLADVLVASGVDSILQALPDVDHLIHERNACIVRIETPEWAARSEGLLDVALSAIWADCRPAAYPYVLTRAHELALITRHERDALEQMLRVEMLRRGLATEESAKASDKRLVAGR